MFKSTRLVLFLVVCFMLNACVSTVESIKIDSITQLAEDTGYLFISLDSEISISDVRISGEQYISLKSPDVYDSVKYYLVPVPAGSYQIDWLGVYWGGRFNLDEDEDKDLWAFTVAPGVISYVGELKVKRFSYGYSSFELINQSSQALEYLEVKYPTILANRELQYHGPGEDSFFDLVFEKQNPVSPKMPNGEESGK